MPNVERPVMEYLHEQTTGTRANDSLRTTESAMDMEPTAEVIGKLSELSFQKHGGPDNSTMPVRL